MAAEVELRDPAPDLPFYMSSYRAPVGGTYTCGIRESSNVCARGGD